MVQRIGGARRKTRNKFQKSYKEKGKVNIRKFMQGFNEGDKVRLKADSSLHGGLYHPKYHGKIGYIQKKKGWCYEVNLKDGGKSKVLIVHPAHLSRV
ncbi:MAG: 50S ribosomal protein L21e [Nanobdellota archaeon]